MELSESGFLDRKRYPNCSAHPAKGIKMGEDREAISEMPCFASTNPAFHPGIANTVDEANACAWPIEIGYPVIVRPAFTLGGTGGGIVQNDSEELSEIAFTGHCRQPCLTRF